MIIGLDTAVAVARQTLADEQTRCAAPTEDAPCSQAALVQAQGALAQAEAERAEAGAAKDVASERAAVTSAQAQLTAARELQTEAQAATLTPLPASEVVSCRRSPVGWTSSARSAAGRSRASS